MEKRFTLLCFILVLSGFLIKNTYASINGVGKSVVEDEVLFSSNFSSLNDFNSKWRIVDADADGVTWEYNQYLSSPDNSSGAAKCNTNNGAVSNDYFVTKTPVTLSAGKNYITFQYRALSHFMPESIRVLYGTSSNPSEMTEIYNDEEFLNQLWWKFGSYNINVPAQGDYYFAFHANSPSNSAGLFLDDVIIGKGSFVGDADLTLSRLVLPSSACGLRAMTQISCTITNKGTTEVDGFDLKLMLNDEEKATVHFSDKLSAGEQREVSLGEIADFSEEGTYDVKIVAVCDADVDLDNNSVSGSVTHYSPVQPEELPRNHVFVTEGRMYADEWLAEGTNDWILQFVGWKANYIDRPLKSRCFNFVPGKYKVEITFSAGNDYLLKSDDFQILLGPTGTDVSTWEVIRTFTDEMATDKTGSVSFNIKEEGVYSFAIVSTKLTLLWIKSFLVKGGFEQDLSIENAKLHSLFTMMPVAHLDSLFDFSATIVNSGTEIVKNAKVSVLSKNDLVLGSSEAKTLSPRERHDVQFKSAMTGYKAGEDALIKIKASMDVEDEFLEDNIKTVSFAVTDSIMALDLATLEKDAVGISQKISYGMLYEFVVADTITSINIGWAENNRKAKNFNLSLYNVEFPSGYLSKKYFTIAAERPDNIAEVNYQVPAFVLKPGYYYIEIEQFDDKSLNVIGDFSDGCIYATSTNPPGYLSAAEYGVGYMMIRPVFGHNGGIVSKDAKVVSFEEPTATKGLFSMNEKVTVIVENTGAEPIKNLPVYCVVNDGTPVAGNIALIQPYSTATVDFVADLSARGENIVSVYTDLEGDERPLNDKMTKSYFNMDPIDPYVMNFEDCQDFTYANFNPAWTTVDGDGSPTVEFQATFPNMQKKMGFVIFNPSETTPPSTSSHTSPYEGEKFGASLRTESGKRNDWLISPKLNIEDNYVLTLYAKSNNPYMGKERFKILISTTDNNIGSFQQVGEVYTVPYEWTLYTVDLSSYSKQAIHIAIQCVTDDGLIFMIDDIRIGLSSSINSVDLKDLITVFPNPAKDILYINANNVNVEEVSIKTLTGSEIYKCNPIATNGQYRINVEDFPKGIYLLNIKSQGNTLTRKVIVN